MKSQRWTAILEHLWWYTITCTFRARQRLECFHYIFLIPTFSFFTLRTRQETLQSQFIVFALVLLEVLFEIFSKFIRASLGSAIEIPSISFGCTFLGGKLFLRLLQKSLLPSDLDRECAAASSLNDF